MADITTFPIPTQILDPANYPEFVGQKGEQGDPGPEIELQTSATHVQWRVVGDESWTDLIALSEITGPEGNPGEDADLTPIAEYTETGATLTFVPAGEGEGDGDIEIPGDGRVYGLTITGDCNLVTGTWPTAPECANVTVAILINTATPPVIALDATWHWASSIAMDIPTSNGAKCVLRLASYPQGWIEASLHPIGVPA